MNEKPTPPRRRWYQFSLRAMFVLVIVVSMPFAWVGYQLHWIKERRAAIESGRVVEGWPGLMKCDAPYGPRIFGERGFVVVGSEAKDMEMAKRLFPEARVAEFGSWPALREIEPHANRPVPGPPPANLTNDPFKSIDPFKLPGS